MGWNHETGIESLLCACYYSKYQRWTDRQSLWPHQADTLVRGDRQVMRQTCFSESNVLGRKIQTGSCGRYEGKEGRH